MVPYSSFMKVKKQLGLNEITGTTSIRPRRFREPRPPDSAADRRFRRSRKSRPRPSLRAMGLGWEGISMTRPNRGTNRFTFSWSLSPLCIGAGGTVRELHPSIAVILSLPIGVFGSFLFLEIMGLANDVYAQIGLVMLVGLLGKKRHPHRRVCGSAPRRGDSPSRKRRSRVESCASSYPDDIIRLHCRFVAAGLRHGSGCHWQSNHRHDRRGGKRFWARS